MVFQYWTIFTGSKLMNFNFCLKKNPVQMKKLVSSIWIAYSHANMHWIIYFINLLMNWISFVIWSFLMYIKNQNSFTFLHWVSQHQLIDLFLSGTFCFYKIELQNPRLQRNLFSQQNLEKSIEKIFRKQRTVCSIKIFFVDVHPPHQFLYQNIQ